MMLPVAPQVFNRIQLGRIAWQKLQCQMTRSGPPQSLPLPSRLSPHHELDKSRSILAPPTTLLCLLLILGCIGAAILWKRKWPLVSFFIVWFFLTLVIESSILPLELIFEHRVYLPSIGFFAVLLSPLVYRAKLSITLGRFSFPIMVASLAICLSVWMTYERNKVW